MPWADGPARSDTDHYYYHKARGASRALKGRPHPLGADVLAMIVLLALAAASSSAGPAHASAPQPGVVEYVPITLTNAQTSPTPASFQQEVNVDWSAYGAYLASDVSNVEFFTTQWSPLYAWCESSCTSGSTSSPVWVNLGGSTVPAGGSLEILMAFYPKTTGEFSATGYWGEASDLSPTYGAYDNGAEVFMYYNDGQTTAGLNVANGGSLGTSSMADPYGKTTNVLALAGNGATTSSAETVAWYGSGVAGDGFVVDGWIDILATSDSSTYNANALQAVRGASPSSLVDYLLGEGWSGAMSAITYESGTTNTVLATSNQTRATGWAWSTTSVSGTALANAIYSAPSYEGGTSLATTSATDSNIGSSETYVGIANWAGAAGQSYFYQWKVRAYPPSGAMPTAALGAAASMATPAAYSVACTTSSASFDMGQYVYGGFTATGSGGNPWTLDYISPVSDVKSLAAINGSPYCDSAGYLIPDSANSPGTWTLQVVDTNGVTVGEATFQVQNQVVPDLPSGPLVLAVAFAAVYLAARRARAGTARRTTET